MDPTVFQIWKLFPPIYIAVGTLGNLFAISLFFRRSIREAPGYVMMVSSSVIDLLILYTSLLDKWLAYGLGRPPLPDLLCKLQVWIASSFRMLEPWFLVLMTAERTILVLKPLRSFSHTKSKAREIVKILILVTFIILLNSHMMYGLTNGKPLNHFTPDRVKCYLKVSPYATFFFHWVIFLSITTFIVPTILLFILDTAVLVRLGKCYCKVPHRSVRAPHDSERAPHGSVRTPHGSVRAPHGSVRASGGSVRAPHGSVRAQHGSVRTQHGSVRAPHSTVIGNASRSLNRILVMNFIFLVTTFPMAVIIITQTYSSLLFTVSNVLLYVRNAVGFLSFLANGHFRKELLAIYRKYAFSWFRSDRKNAIGPITENP